MRSSFNKITSKEELRSRIDAALPALMQNFPEELKHVVRRYEKRHIVTKIFAGIPLILIGLLTIIFMVSLVTPINFEEFFSHIYIYGTLIFLGVIFLIVVKFYASTLLLLNYQLNQYLLPRIVNFFNLNAHFIEQPYDKLPNPTFNSKPYYIEYDRHTEQGKEILNLIKKSELRGELDRRLRIDSILSIEGLSANELISAEIEYVFIKDGVRRSRIVPSFKGYFFAINLRSESLNHSVILLERYHQSFIEKLLVKYDVLDPVPTDPDEEFDDVLSVLSTNHTELEAFLDADTRRLLKQMWRESNGIIRISFVGTYMYMFYGCPKVRIGRTVMAVTENNLKSYMYDVASPLSNIFEFVEKAVSYTQTKT